MEEGQGLANIAVDAQSSHNNEIERPIRRLVQIAMKDGAGDLGEGEYAALWARIEGMGDSSLALLQQHCPAAAGRNMGSVREAILLSLTRFHRDLKGVVGGIMGDGGAALGLVTAALRRAGLALGSKFDEMDGVVVPVAQALLDAQTSYGWDQPGCGQGSITMLLSVLQGRIDAVE